jgi:type IV secretory pathway VirJ component
MRRAFAAVAVICCVRVAPAYALEAGRLGSVKVVEPPGEARGVVIFFSGGKSLTKTDDDEAQTIAKSGALVAEVDGREYLDRLDKTKPNEKCHELVYDVEWLSRDIQRVRKFPSYLTPIVAGVGEAGTIAEIILDQAPAATIAGAVSLDPAETIASIRPLCSDVTAAARGHCFRYSAPKKLEGFWTVGLTRRISKRDRDYIMTLRREGAPIDLREIAANVMPADALREMIEPHLAKLHRAAMNPSLPSDISGLPLAELPVAHPGKLMAIVLSGDGGWRDLDKTIADDLQRDGVPVVGLDSLRYFWSKKTPEQIANVVAALMETFMAKWNTDKVALIGYSFGADVMPFVYNQLPENLRDHVTLIALLGFSKTADFEITVRGWLGEPPGTDAIPTLPEADKISSRLIQCFYGSEEGDTACPALASRGVDTYKRNGAHHFDGNYGALEDLILKGFKQRAGVPAR